jgi:hypothetical protein
MRTVGVPVTQGHCIDKSGLPDRGPSKVHDNLVVKPALGVGLWSPELPPHKI